jgi:hypothetical protein
MHMAHIVREMRGVAPTANGVFFFTRNLVFLHLFLTGYLIHHIGSGDSRAPKAESSRLLTKKSDQPWYFFGLRGTNQPPQGPSIRF